MREWSECRSGALWETECDLTQPMSCERCAQQARCEQWNVSPEGRSVGRGCPVKQEAGRQLACAGRRQED